MSRTGRRTLLSKIPSICYNDSNDRTCKPAACDGGTTNSMALLAGNVIAVGGGRGGVGKSFFAANIACALAQGGRKVILIDADLAGANVHILFGIKHPEHTVGDYLKKKVGSFSDVLLPTMLPDLRLICGASDLLEVANPHYAQKQKIISELARLDADCIIIDIGAGAGVNNLDFFVRNYVHWRR